MHQTTYVRIDGLVYRVTKNEDGSYEADEILSRRVDDDFRVESWQGLDPLTARRTVFGPVLDGTLFGRPPVRTVCEHLLRKVIYQTSDGRYLPMDDPQVSNGKYLPMDDPGAMRPLAVKMPSRDRQPISRGDFVLILYKVGDQYFRTMNLARKLGGHERVVDEIAATPTKDLPFEEEIFMEVMDHERFFWPHLRRPV